MSRMCRRARWAAGLGLAAALLAGAIPAMAQPPMEALPSILQLQLSQHPAWRAYKDAAAERRADAAHSAAQAPLLNAMTTPARLDALRSQIVAQQQSFEHEAAATQAFYAVLSPDQRRIFDEVTRLPTQPSPMHAGPPGDARYRHVLRSPPSATSLPPPVP